MTGPSLAPLIIPIVGTLFLTAWLTLVFYAGRHPQRAAGHPAAGRDDRPSAMSALRLPGQRPTDMAGPSINRHSRLQRRTEVHVMFEVER